MLLLLRRDAPRDGTPSMDVRTAAVTFALSGVEFRALRVSLQNSEPEGFADEAPQTDAGDGTASAGAGPAVVVARGCGGDGLLVCVGVGGRSASSFCGMNIVDTGRVCNSVGHCCGFVF